jgi:hypothetical protein
VQTAPPPFLTIPTLAKQLGEHPATIRRIADRLAPSIPRMGWLVRVIDAALAERIKAEVERRRQRKGGTHAAP